MSLQRASPGGQLETWNHRGSEWQGCRALNALRRTSGPARNRAVFGETKRQERGGVRLTTGVTVVQVYGWGLAGSCRRVSVVVLSVVCVSFGLGRAAYSTVCQMRRLVPRSEICPTSCLN